MMKKWMIFATVFLIVVIAFGVYFAVLMALNSVAYFAFCIGFLVYPAISAYTIFLYGSMYGEAFRELDAKYAALEKKKK